MTYLNYLADFANLTALWVRQRGRGSLYNGTLQTFANNGAIYRLDDDHPDYLTYVGQERIFDNGVNEYHTSSQVDLRAQDFSTDEPVLSYYNENDVGNSLTNTGDSITSVRGSQTPMIGYYISRTIQESYAQATVDTTTLGSKSLLFGGWFRTGGTEQTNLIETPFMYGDATGTFIKFQIGGVMCGISLKGTGDSDTITKAVSVTQARDSKWHYFGVLLNRPNNTGYFIMTNQTYEIEAFEEFDIAGLGAFDTADAKLTLAGRQNGTTVDETFFGDISNFQAYTWTGSPSPITVNLVLHGIREACSKGITITRGGSNGVRLGNFFTITGTQRGDYTYAILNADEGEYLFNPIEHVSPTSGFYRLSINQQGVYSESLNGPVDNNRTTRIDNKLKMPRGANIVKIELDNSSNNSFACSFSAFRFTKFNGTNENGGRDILLLGDELTKKSASMQLNTVHASPYNSGLYHDAANSIPVGASAEGAFYVAEGLYDMIIYMQRRVDGAIVDVMLNDHHIATIDTYEGTESFSQTRIQTRLEQGKNVIRFVSTGKNTSSSGFRYTIDGVRMTMINGTSFDSTITIDHADDGDRANGTSIVHLSNALDQNSSYIVGMSMNNEWQKPIWLDKGVYDVRLDYLRGQNGGNTLVQMDDATLFTINNYSASTIYGARERRFFVVTRTGYHNIIVQNDGTTPGTSHHTFINKLRFVPVGKFAHVPQHRQNSLVKLGQHVALTNETNAPIRMGGVSVDRYKEIIAYIRGKTVGTGGVFMRINGIETNAYEVSGMVKFNGADLTGYEATGNSLQLFWSNELGSGANRAYRAEVKISLDDFEGVTHPQGTVETISENHSHRNAGWTVNGDLTHLNEFEIIATGNGWRFGSNIDIYGVLE